MSNFKARGHLINFRAVIYERILIYGPRQKIVYKKCFHGNHCLSPNIVTTPPSNCMQSFQKQSFCDLIYINVSTEHKHVHKHVKWYFGGSFCYGKSPWQLWDRNSSSHWTFFWSVYPLHPIPPESKCNIMHSYTVELVLTP